MTLLVFFLLYSPLGALILSLHCHTGLVYRENIYSTLIKSQKLFVNIVLTPCFTKISCLCHANQVVCNICSNSTITLNFQAVVWIDYIINHNQKHFPRMILVELQGLLPFIFLALFSCRMLLIYTKMLAKKKQYPCQQCLII